MKENKKMNNTEFIMAKGTMTIETFMDVLKDALAFHLPDCILEVQEAQKNNGVILHGIRIMEPESNIAPCIYLDDAFIDYQDGRDFQEIVTAVAENYKQNRPVFGFDATFITDYEHVKERICFKVINTDLNKELLADVPHVPFHDLSVVFYVLIDSIPGQNASIMVHNSHMADWEVDTDELFKTAKSNTQRILRGKVMSMRDLIAGVPNNLAEDRMPEAENCDMYVATNRESVNGAAVFLYDSLLSGFADKIGRDFYIIPSSIHELIFLPDDLDMEPERIKQMVCEVNAACVDPEEVLSNNVYHYMKDTGLMEMVA